MSLTLKNAKLKANTWYELHQVISDIKGSSVALDKAISFVQLSEGEIHCCISVNQPDDEDYGYELVRDYGGMACGANEPGGFWVRPYLIDALINIKEL